MLLTRRTVNTAPSLETSNSLSGMLTEPPNESAATRHFPVYGPRHSGRQAAENLAPASQGAT